MKARKILLKVLVLLYFPIFAQELQFESYVNTNNSINFFSSDDEFVKAFNWAKQQALMYAFEGDAVGLWYEAALPGREVFCMRDVSHQAMGAHFLGLAHHTKNMLLKFAKNISDARDWCSIWEITRHGTPALQDYLNDQEFWYNLPANFDILNCCFRMYNLTGDQDYLENPIFLNFYKKTVYDYIERWDIGIDKVMNRNRYINNSPENKRKFKNNRGIPGYLEGDSDYIVGLDLLTSQQAALEAYARIQLLKQDNKEAELFFSKSDEISKFINTIWWDNENNRYYTHVNNKYELKFRGFDYSTLYFGTKKDTLKLRKTIEHMIDFLPNQSANFIEALSHLPEILYKCEEPEMAREMILAILKSERKEYPEASFCTIGAMVAGLMGVEPDIYPNRNSIQTGHFGEQAIITKPRLTDKTKWTEMKEIPFKRNSLSIRHEGNTKTVFTNNSGPQLRWKACFTGLFNELLLNGKPVKANTEKIIYNDSKVSWIWVTVGPGETMTVQVL